MRLFLLGLLTLLAACARDPLPEVNWPPYYNWSDEVAQRLAPQDLAGLEQPLQAAGVQQAYTLEPTRTRCRLVMPRGNYREAQAVIELEALRVKNVVQDSSRYRPFEYGGGDVESHADGVGGLQSTSVYAYLPPSRRPSDGLLLMYFVTGFTADPEGGLEVALCAAYARPQ